MTDSLRDLDDLLRATNPVAEERLPLPSESPGAQLLYEKITGTPYAGRASSHRPRRRRWVGPGVAAVLALAGGSVAAAYAVSGHVTTRLAVSCYAAPSLTSTALASAAESAGPVATCSQAWATGSIGSGPIPLLVACLTPQGVAAVFPSAVGADVCAQLGLPALPARATSLTTGPVAPHAAVSRRAMPPAVRDAIINELRGSCFTASDAELYIGELLAKADLDWTVVAPSAFPPGRQCASPGFDEAGYQVVLTGRPPPTSAGS